MTADLLCARQAGEDSGFFPEMVLEEVSPEMLQQEQFCNQIHLGNSLWPLTRPKNILTARRNPTVKDLSKPVFPRGVWLWNSFIKEPLIAFHKTSVL